MYKGIVQFFDGEEGFIFCTKTNQSYYVHISAVGPYIDIMKKKNEVLFSLYTNLYMRQVDKIEPIK